MGVLHVGDGGVRAAHPHVGQVAARHALGGQAAQTLRGIDEDRFDGDARISALESVHQRGAILLAGRAVDHDFAFQAGGGDQVLPAAGAVAARGARGAVAGRGGATAAGGRGRAGRGDRRGGLAGCGDEQGE